MAPEVLHGFNESTPKIDIWSLGVILHGLVLGYLPFGGANNEEIKKQIKEKEIIINLRREHISKECRDLILKMLTKDPNKRISISEILDHPWICQYREEA